MLALIAPNVRNFARLLAFGKLEKFESEYRIFKNLSCIKTMLCWMEIKRLENQYLKVWEENPRNINS